MSGNISNSNVWFRESVPLGLEIGYQCDGIVYSGRSRYQQIDIVDTTMHGRMLFLDGVAQSAERDEFVYHEMLVHPALFSHPDPKSVLVIGGAEGATVREVFRHPGVERVVMVDIDGELVDICKQYLYPWHQGTYDDPRMELVIGDGRQYVEESSDRFDAIIVDLSDPLEGSPAVLLFTREFYRLLEGRLTPRGAITVQGEGIGPQDMMLHVKVANTLRSVFPKVYPYPYTLYSFHRPDAHILATANEEWSLDTFVQRVARADLALRHFSPEIARGMFSLPSYLYQAYASSGDILTDKSIGSHH